MLIQVSRRQKIIFIAVTVFCFFSYWFITRIVFRVDIAYGPASDSGIVPRIEMYNGLLPYSNCELIADVDLIDKGNVVHRTTVRFPVSWRNDGVWRFANSMHWNSSSCLKGTIDFGSSHERISICKTEENAWKAERQVTMNWPEPRE